MVDSFEKYVAGKKKIAVLLTSSRTETNLTRYCELYGIRVPDDGFHSTLIMSENKIFYPNTTFEIPPFSVTAIDSHPLGDHNFPVLAIEYNPILRSYREHFENGLRWIPTFKDFLPHVTLSYEGGTQVPPILPDFPLEFDKLKITDAE